MSREEGLDLLHVKVERMMRTNWHTPSTEDHKSDGPNAQGRYGTEKMKTSDQRLRNQVWNWPSPRSEDSESCGNHPGAVDSLTGAARMWPNYQKPLPYFRPKPVYQTRLPNETSSEYWERMTDYETENGINPAEGGMHCPTPAARDYRSPNAASHMDRSTGAKHLDQLPNFIEHCFLPDPPTSTHGGKSLCGSTRRLNPDFVDWLMGLPPGWTDYAPLETASYLSKVRSLLRSFLGGRAK